MPTRKEMLMRSANLLNDFAFKYVFGEDCKEANDALKSLLTVFLERKVNHVVVKNSEMVKDYTKMKSPRLDLLVEFDDQTSVDLAHCPLLGSRPPNQRYQHLAQTVQSFRDP